jgi:lipoate-protein ligase A
VTAETPDPAASVSTSTARPWLSSGLVRGPAQQLLADGAALLERLADDPRPVLRWYRSTDTALVLGRGQALGTFAESALPVVQRFSGGGAVLMDDGLLSLDVVLPTGHPLLAGDPLAVFARIGRAWADALHGLGVADIDVATATNTPSRRGSDREQLLAAICYATLGVGEVTTGGRKVVGLAQRRRKPGVLVQCGLLRRWNPQPLLRALGADADDDQIRAAAMGIDQLLDDPPSDEAVIAAVEDALQRVVAQS